MTAEETEAGMEAVCTWCGVEVPADDGFRLAEMPSGGTAVFCRLEHVIPWLIKGARWDEPGAGVAGTEADPVELCSWCEAALGVERVLLVRRRGEHRIGDGFCDLEHLGTWARAGGRFR